MPESKSGALPLGDSPSKPVTISFCDEITQGMRLNRVCVNESRTANQRAARVVRLGGEVMNPLQKLPCVALARRCGRPGLCRGWKPAIDDTENSGSRTGHPCFRHCGTSGIAEVDPVECAQCGTDRAMLRN